MFNWLYKSKGVKRTLGIIFFLASGVPDLAMYSSVLFNLGAIFGVTGVGNAGIDKLKK